MEKNILKRIILNGFWVFLCSINACILFAQNPIDINIEVFEPYPVELDYYLENADNLFITVSNTSGIEQQIYYHVRIIGDNGIDAQTFTSIKPSEPVKVPSYRTLFYSSEELARDFPFSYPEDTDLSNISPEQLDYITFNRALPEGTYQICITARDWNTDIALSFQCSDEFYVSYGDIPFIYMPYDEEVVFASENSHVTIGWEPPFTLQPPTGTFEYNLKMIDITNDQFGDLELLLNDPGQYPTLDVFGLTETIYNYDVPIDPELIEGHQYALRVQAVDNSGSFPLANNGYSEVSTFWYGFNPNEDTDGDDEGPNEADNECYEACYYEESINESIISSSAALSSIAIGQFEITELSITNPNGNSTTGTGVVTIPFLNNVKVDVEFSNLTINTNGRVISGSANAVVDQLYDPTQMNSTIGQEMNNFIRNGRVISSLASNSSIGMPLGLIQNIAGHNFMFGFTQMQFDATTANCQLMQNLHIPQFGDEGWVSMAGSDICLTPGGFGGEFTLHPVNDYQIPYEGDMMLYINGSSSDDLTVFQDEATYFEVDCNGLKSFGLNGEVHFPKSTLVKENEDGEILEEKVVGSFSTRFERAVDEENNVYSQYGNEGVPEEAGLHFLVQVEIDPFQIVGIQGWGFEMKEAWLDCSDFENPPNIQWPESYDDANISLNENNDPVMLATWTGVYIKELDIKTPVEFLGGANREGMGVNNMIIDPLVTMTVSLKDILGQGEGEVDDWSLSMDSLFLTVVQNRLESGGFSGLLGMPITSENQYLRYTALIEDSNTTNTSLDPPSYIFSVSPEDEISFPFMCAQVALSDNSYVMGKFTPSNENETYFEANFEGGVGISSELFEPEDENASIPLYLPVVDFQLVYNSQSGFEQSNFGFCEELEPWDENGGVVEYDLSWGNQFTEESFAGFPLNIEEAGLTSISPSEIQFNVTPRVTIAGNEGGIAGSVGINFNSILKNVGGEKKLKLQSISVSSLYILSEIHGLTLEGEVEFYNDIGSDQVGAKGARGGLQVLLPIGMGVKLAAEFGTQISNPSAAYGTNENFNYWYLDGMAYFAPGGVPISPAAGIYGIGGGVYVNMTRGNYGAMSQNDVNEMLGSTNGLESSFENLNPVIGTGSLPTPDFGSYGIKMATTLGTLPTETLLNMDVSLYGEFSQNQGINLIEIAGDAFMMTPLSLRNKSNFWASAAFRWEKISPSHNVFDGSLDVYVNTPTIHGNPSNNNKMIGASFHIDQGGDDKWWFHAGNPDDRGMLVVDFPFVGSASATGYLMTGHNLPTDLPIPDKVAWLMDNPSTGDEKNNLDNQSPVKKDGEKRDSDILNTLGSGIAFGAELQVTAGIDAFLIYATCTAYLGFDINITKSEERTCFISGEGNIAPGINGWYARGQVYAGLEGDIGIKFRFKGKGFDLSLFKMGAAMMVSGGGPNPEWIEGRAGVYYSVLQGAVKGYKKFDITIGEKCVPDYEDPFGDLEIIYETYPAHEEKDISVFVDPMISFILSVGEEIVLPIIKDNGKTKDLTIELELQSLRIEEDKGNNSSIPNQIINQQEQVWNSDKNQVTVELDEVLSEFTDHTMTAKLIGWEIKNYNKVILEDDDGNQWKEEKSINFKTGKIPYPIPDDEIFSTIPIRRQRFLLQDDVLGKIGKIEFTKDMKDNDPDKGYFPEDNDQFDYSYFVRWQDLKGNEAERFELNSIESTNVIDNILSIFPELLNNTIYSCQLIRLKLPKRRNTVDIQLNFKIEDNLNQMKSTTEIVVGTEPLDPGKTAGDNEEIIYQFYFKTSQYNSFQEKMNSMTIETENINEEIPKYEFVDIHLSGDEGFDIFDVKGELDEKGVVITKPRMRFFCEDDYESMFIDLSHMGFGNERSSENLSNKTAQEKYFDFIKQKWNDYMDDASPVWFGSNRTGWSGGIYDITYEASYSRSGVTYRAEKTIECNLDPPDYPFTFPYWDDIISMDFNDLITGYKQPLNDTEIENAWNKHLAGGGSQYMADIKGDILDKFSSPAGLTQQSGINFTGGNNKDLDMSSNFEHTNLGIQNEITLSSNDTKKIEVNGNAVPKDDQNNIQLTIPFDLHKTSEQDAYWLWRYAYDHYYEMHNVSFTFNNVYAPSKMPPMEDVNLSFEMYKWKNYLQYNEPGFMNALESVEDRSLYYLNANNGKYYFKIEPNISFGDVHIAGNKKVFDFITN